MAEDVQSSPRFSILHGSAKETLSKLPEKTFRCCITSPPYFALRDTNCDGQIGLEKSPIEYANSLVDVFKEVRRVLTDDGTLWLNIGDSYVCSPRGNKKPGGGKLTNSNISSGVEEERWKSAKAVNKSKVSGCKQKDLIGIPWTVALALRADGWYLRSSIIWMKPNCKPESVKDRPTNSHENIFMFSKKPKYYYDRVSVREEALSKDCDEDGMRNCRDVWVIPTRPSKKTHFSVFPEELPTRCLKAGSQPGDIVLDCFAGSGTTGVAALRNERRFTGIELMEERCRLIKDTIIESLA